MDCKRFSLFGCKDCNSFTVKIGKDNYKLRSNSNNRPAHCNNLGYLPDSHNHNKCLAQLDNNFVGLEDIHSPIMLVDRNTKTYLFGMSQDSSKARQPALVQRSYKRNKFTGKALCKIHCRLSSILALELQQAQDNYARFAVVFRFQLNLTHYQRLWLYLRNPLTVSRY